MAAAGIKISPLNVNGLHNHDHLTFFRSPEPFQGFIFTGMMKILLYILLFYILYKVIFDFILPVSRATSQVKDKIREMQQTQEQQYRQQQAAASAREQQNTSTAQNTKPAGKESDYIEFEEIK